ncbi:MAG: 23S rRNA (guanosine(2251)-2'-O)-methyltransferase RlmB [Arsenophonus sp.]|nr:MAG: 23S rRNA (guanosine(2251)-2'-O)-methyltransferase RlmB [Arsenophonus sp.]
MHQIIYGIHTIEEIIRFNPIKIKQLYIKKGKLNKRLISIINKLKNLDIKIQFANKKWMDSSTNNAVHQGIIAYINKNKEYQISDIDQIIKKKQNPFLLILNKIVDPYNLGACLRSANAANVDIVFITKKKSAPLNETVRKTSSGSIDYLKIIKVTNTINLIKLLKKKNITIIGTDSAQKNKNIYSSNFKKPLALIVGSENLGISKEIKKNCDTIIKIPILGNIQSLNVSVTTGIFLFEIIRQRLFTK